MGVFGTSLAAGAAVGVAIAKTSFGQHVGLAYRTAVGVRLVHLAWHGDLQDQAVAGHQAYLFGDASLHPLEATALAGILANVQSAVGWVPYGVDWEAEDSFDDQGKLKVLPLGKGLTCATFIEAVLRHHRYVVVDRPSWPIGIAEDRWFKFTIVRGLIKYFRARPEIDEVRRHARAMLKEKDRPRLRPAQIAASVAHARDAWPMPHAAADLAGDRLSWHLNGQVAGGLRRLL